MRRLPWAILGTSLAWCLLTGVAAAQHPESRAGCPQRVSCLARPSESPHDVGYYVGGGAAFKGHAPCLDEGTWGWDYGGCLLPHRVFLNWWHGQRYQGGRGAYQTDGPRLLGTLPKK